MRCTRIGVGKLKTRLSNGKIYYIIFYMSEEDCSLIDSPGGV
jgi:hypothetical protein